MATKTADLHIRIDPALKTEAERYFDKVGVTMSQALEQFLSWTVWHQKTPMRLKRKAKIPDLSTMTNREITAMLDNATAEAQAGNYHTLDEVRREINSRYVS